MPKCARCSAPNSEDMHYCGQCGAALTARSPASLIATEVSHRTGTAVAPRTSSSGTDSTEDGRFVPGTLLGDRYRIVSLLGAGGMGEVYRATDLRLGQPVALKFLPDDMARDPKAVARFHNEVRIARQVAHPNVCRVYDLGEVEGFPYLSMEYVDGEDLHSLLRRIGRLPSDKALEMARKICAGLAAAHDKGVLHRDLKPSNIMLDGRGEVLIMDFGLAGLAHEIEDVRSGTPAYMAPEQLAGKEVTARSDIYALGLVLYELFTGKPAFEGKTREEIVRVRRDSTPHRPSTLVHDLDPGVERVILRCLEVEPENRPASALMVSAALPGGDPLAAALAAGETPSPEIVAAAGETAGLPVRTALASLAFTLLGLIAFYLLSAHTNGFRKMELPYSAEVLAQRSRDMVHQLGYTTPSVDFATGFFYDGEYLKHLDHAGGMHPNWDWVLQHRPSVLSFWYRQSPDFLVADEFKSNLLTPCVVTLEDPPPVLSGMVEVSLDPEGRLTHLAAIPPQKDSTP